MSYERKGSFVPEQQRRWLPLTVIIPVKNGGRLLEHLVRHLNDRLGAYDFEVVVIDSGSTDGTRELIRRQGEAYRLVEIPPEDFGHGKTRNLGAQEASRKIVCYITHDVLPCTKDWPEIFTRSFDDRLVAGVYGRQVPRNAPSIEMFFVSLNYPEERIRYGPSHEEGPPRPGRVLFSDAFSALRRELLLASPHPEDVKVSEDQLFARRMLAQGYHILYEPEAEALHAHSYTLRGLWNRIYPTAYSLAEADLDTGVTMRESLRFLGQEIRWFVRNGHSHWLPWLALYEATRYVSFQAGRCAGRRSGARRDREKAKIPEGTGSIKDAREDLGMDQKSE